MATAAYEGNTRSGVDLAAAGSHGLAAVACMGCGSRCERYNSVEQHTLAFSGVIPGGQKPPNLRNRLVPATLVFFTTMNLYVGLKSSVQIPALGGDSPACMTETSVPLIGKMQCSPGTVAQHSGEHILDIVESCGKRTGMMHEGAIA